MLFEKGTLWQSIIDKTGHALGAGAQHPISTEYEFIEDNGVHFFVRVLSSLARKDEERKKREKEYSAFGTKVNPFLPYERDLFVADVSESHVALLNKFNVVNHHLLIITRDFEDQETLLTRKDFEALWTCMAEYDGLGFYNGGEAAGASQQHKHLQIVPLPLTPDQPPVPIEPLIEDMTFSDDLGTTPHFAFTHIFARLGRDMTTSPKDAAAKTCALYNEMLRRTNAAPLNNGTALRQSKPYCLIVTRDWMFLVPRSREFFEGISINALGFAGTLLVRNNDQMELLKKHGPMTALREVSLPMTENEPVR